MNPSHLKMAASWAGALLLAWVFLYASVPKLLDPALFGQSIHRYEMLPGTAVSLMAIYLPWLECCAAVFLMVPHYRRGASVLIGAMLVIFLVATTNALVRDLDISCGCFSRTGDEESIGGIHILRNVALLALTCVVFWTSRPATEPDAV